MLNNIKLGMDVYDSSEHDMGTVQFIHIADSTNEVIDEDTLPSNASDEVRNQLREEGYIRIGSTLFSGGSYATAKEIDRVQDGNVYLKIEQSKILRD